MCQKHRITICVKNPEWYEAAKYHGSVKEYEKWDDVSIARYRRELALEFNFSVLSVEILENEFAEITFYNEKGQKVLLPFRDLRIIAFKGHTQQQRFYISESILDQQIDQKKRADKAYFYVYINEYAKVTEIADNIWFSEEHANLLKEHFDAGYSVDNSLTKPVLSGGILL